MHDRMWPDYGLVKHEGWTAKTETEWKKFWESNWTAAAKAGRPIAANRMEIVPWGAIMFGWREVRGEFTLECLPVVAKSPAAARKVQELGGQMFPSQWTLGGIGSVSTGFLLLQYVGPQPWELAVAAVVGVAGFIGGRKYDATCRAAVQVEMDLESLPVVLAPLRAIRQFGKPWRNRKLAAALERLYAGVVTDFWGAQEYVGDADEAVEALDAIEECVDALEGLEALGQLKPNRDVILQALDTKKPAAAACTALAAVLGGLRDDATAAAAAAAARAQELAAPQRISPAERAINQQHAADLLAADATALEEARRRYRDEAAAYDEGTQRYRDLP